MDAPGEEEGPVLEPEPEPDVPEGDPVAAEVPVVRVVEAEPKEGFAFPVPELEGDAEVDEGL